MHLSTILSLSLAAVQTLAAPTAETLNTISNAPRQESHLNPRWEENHVERDSILVNADDGVSKRGRPVWKNTVCSNPNKWYPAFTATAFYQMEQLRGWKGIPIVPGKKCVEVIKDGTRGYSEIWLCNDNAGELRLPGYLDVADAAERIIKTCKYVHDSGDLLRTLGQQFVEGNWNVIVRGESLRQLRMH